MCLFTFFCPLLYGKNTALLYVSNTCFKQTHGLVSFTRHIDHVHVPCPSYGQLG